MNFNDPFRKIRDQQEYLNNIVNSPALKAFQEHQSLLDNIVNSPALKALQEHQSLLDKITIPALSINTDYYSSIFKVSNDLRKNQNLYSQALAEPINIFNNLFHDLTLDNLDVIEEIFNDVNITPELQEGNSDITATLTVNTPNSANLVSDMTSEELTAVVTQAFQAAQSNINMNMEPRDRIRAFFIELITDIGKDAAKSVTTFIIKLLVISMVFIAVNNHDYEVGQLIGEKISDTEIVKDVKKAFIKNPEVEKPLGAMAFLRTETKLRTRPTKESHLILKEPVSKNTVVFPIERSGNWVLIEVETKDEFYTGWVEQSKVINFKLDKN